MKVVLKLVIKSSQKREYIRVWEHENALKIFTEILSF